MKYYILIILPFILLINSCKNGSEKVSDLKIIEIVELPVNDLDFFKIVDNYKFIKLKTPKEVPIGNIHKILFTTDRIIILDIGKGIYSFNLEGNFINKYGNKGRGPGEWIYPQDIAFDKITQTLIVYCRTSKKMVLYTSQGSFINESYLGLTFRSMEYLNKDTIIIFSHATYNILQEYGELTYDLIAINSNLDVFHTQFANNTEPNIGKTVMTHNKYFCKTESGIFLHWPFIDTIYLIKNNTLNAMPFLHLNFKDKRINNKMIDSNSHLELFDKIIEDKNRTIIRPVHVAGNLMLLEFSAGINVAKPDDNYRILYNIETGEQFNFRNIKYGTKNCNWKNPIGVNDDYFINVLEYEDFICIKNNNKDNKIVREVKEFENPVILLYKLKIL